MSIPVDQVVRHPLDPLTAGEVEQTTRILNTSGRITPRVRIMAYSLLEPAKERCPDLSAGSGSAA